MSIIEEKCKQKGVRLTDQRKIIAKVLSESKEVYGSKDHPDVDELHKRVSVIDNKLSKSEIRRAIQNKGLKLNNVTINDEKLIVSKDQLDNKNYFKLSHGKKKHVLLKFTN